jgi:glycosyltransferase involved in cell wall biosynthesis
MRILVLCDRAPFSMHDGLVLRLVNFVRELSARHSFDLICLARPDSNADPELSSCFAAIETHPYPKPTSRAMGLRGRLSRLSPQAIAPMSPAAAASISRALSSGRYDLVLDAAGNMLRHLPRHMSVPLVVDSVDELVLAQWRRLASAPVTEWVHIFRRLLEHLWFERTQLRRAVLNVLASEEDARVARWVCREVPAVTIPNGVDTGFFAPMQEVPAEPDSIAFEGSMRFGPNVDAAMYLCREIFPLIKARRPSAKLWLIGRDPAPAVRALASESIIVTGTVPDVRPYLARAAVFVCAMRQGAGIKNKILQAWSMGKAVVATSRSLGGLPAKDGFNLLIRNSPAQFAEATDSLLADAPRRLLLGFNARTTVTSGYGWSAQSERLESELLAAWRSGAKCRSRRT